jgi:hypothetical protein
VLREALTIAVAQSTSCAFARPGLHRLYVTSATENWSDAQRRPEPAAGLVYRFDTDAIGRRTSPFRPDPSPGRRSRDEEAHEVERIGDDGPR